MSQLPPPPPPATTPEPAPTPAPTTESKPGKGKAALIIAAALLLLAAAGAAAVVFIPSLAVLAGLPGAASASQAAAAPSVTAAAAAPSTAVPAPTASATAGPTPSFEMAPEITSAPPAPQSSPPAAPAASSGSAVDLGLAIPVDIVPCNGKYLTFYVSTINPATYATDIQTALNTYPGSRYLTTEGSCSALNQISRNGTRIYGVYSGPHDSAAEACLARAGVPGSYVKVMNPSTNPEATVPCS